MNPEQDFLAWIERRDAEALGRVFDATAGRLLLLAAHLAGPDGADDLVQATFLKAMTRGRAWDRDRPLWPWLAGILHHEAGMRWRQRERRREVGLEAALEKTGEAPGPLREAVSAEVFEALQRTIDELPLVYRQVLRLRIVHDLQPIEIARALELPVGTVRSQLHRGLERLRERLPRGVAGLVGVMVLDDGAALAAMRAKVVAEAEVLAGSVAAAGASAQVWMFWTAWSAMKSKWVVGSAVAAVLLSIFVWQALAGPGDPESPPTAVPSQPRVATAAHLAEVDRPPTDLDAGRSEVQPDLPVADAWTLRVEVTGADGLPRADVPVRAWVAARRGSAWDGDQGEDHREDLGAGVTDVDGKWHCSLGAVRDRSLLFHTTNLLFVAVADRVEPQALLALPGPSDREGPVAEIELREGPRLTGLVLDSQGMPVAGVRLFWRFGDSNAPAPSLEEDSERSDAEGRFRLSCDLEQEVRPVGLVVYSPGAGQAELRLPEELQHGRPSKDLDLGIIHLGVGATVRGRVTLGDGAPLAHFPVRLQAIDRSPADPPGNIARALMTSGGGGRGPLTVGPRGVLATSTVVESGADGRFVFAGLDPDATYAVWVRDSSLHGFEDCLVLTTPGGEPVALRVDRHLLVLDILSERGERLPGIGLMAEGLDPTRDTPVPPTGRRYTVRNAAFFGVPDGRLSLLSPFGWTWRIATGDEGAIADVLHHDAVEGLHRAERTLQLRPETRFGALRLVVVDDAGEPLSSYGYTLRCADREIERRSMMPPADGLLGDLPAGRWTLTLRLGEQLHYGWWGNGPGARGSASVDCEVVDGEVVEVPVVAPPMGRVVLRIQVGSGESPPNTIQIRNEADGSVQGFDLTARLEAMARGTLADRVYLLRNAFPPGRHVFVVTADGYAASRCVVDVVADRATEAAVGLSPL